MEIEPGQIGKYKPFWAADFETVVIVLNVEDSATCFVLGLEDSIVMPNDGDPVQIDISEFNFMDARDIVQWKLGLSRSLGNISFQDLERIMKKTSGSPTSKKQKDFAKVWASVQKYFSEQSSSPDSLNK